MSNLVEALSEAVDRALHHDRDLVVKLVRCTGGKQWCKLFAWKPVECEESQEGVAVKWQLDAQHPWSHIAKKEKPVFNSFQSHA